MLTMLLLTAGVCADGASPTEAAQLGERLRPLLAEPIGKSRSMGDTLSVMDKLARIISHQEFPALPAADRHAALYRASAFAYSLSDMKPALAWITQASEMEESGPDDWDLRFRIAAFSGEGAVIRVALTELAEKYPATLSAIDPTLLLGITLAVAKDPAGSAKDMRDVLFDANYLAFGRVNPSAVWLYLATDLLEQGNSERARQVAARIEDFESFLRLRVDSRYAGLLAQNPFVNSPGDLLKHQLRAAGELFRLHPRSSYALFDWINTLTFAARFDEALAVLDNAIKVTPLRQSPLLSIDDSLAANWLHDGRASILSRMGRFEEALAAYEKASQLPERGKENTSQRLNLAFLNCKMGRGKQAREAAKKAPGASGYGEMNRQRALHCAAILLQDGAAEARALAYLKSHWRDAPSRYAEALIHANDIDGAAELLIARLQAQDLRWNTLFQLQDLYRGAETALVKEWRERERQLLTRDDVKAALEQVGTIEKLDLVH